jgi:membrane fusion protein (multidrug efflux system)
LKKKKIYVDEGQYVKEGQLLFKILPTMRLNIKAIAEVKARDRSTKHQGII